MWLRGKKWLRMIETHRSFRIIRTPMNPAETDQAYPPRQRAAAEDAALIARMAGGEEAALAALYDRWTGGVYAVIMQLLQDADDAEDVLEETFWQAWRTAGSYDPERAGVSTWLLTIARSRAIDRLRSRSRSREVPLDGNSGAETLIASATTDAEAEHADRRRIVAQAMADLPLEQRVVLDLGYFHGMSQSEIAEQTGQPLGTVKTRMRLGMQKLREQLGVLREESTE